MLLSHRVPEIPTLALNLWVPNYLAKSSHRAVSFLGIRTTLYLASRFLGEQVGARPPMSGPGSVHDKAIVVDVDVRGRIDVQNRLASCGCQLRILGCHQLRLLDYDILATLSLRVVAWHLEVALGCSLGFLRVCELLLGLIGEDRITMVIKQ